MKTATRIALLLALAAPLAASAAQGPKWKSWLGCWSVVPAEQTESGHPVVCITPTASADAVVLSAVAGGTIVSRDTIDASGRAIPVTAVGCTGTRNASWSSDERRVYLKSAVDCDGLRTNVSAILAMTPKGEWLDVRRIAAGEGTDVRVARYRSAGTPASLPTELASALRAAGTVSADARVATGEAAGISAVIEASRTVHEDVVEAWIAEGGDQFAVDGQTLKELQRAGVPGKVSDALVATSSSHSSGSRPWVDDYIRPYGRGASDFWDQGTGIRLVGSESPMYDPWGFGYGPFGDRVYNTTIAGDPAFALSGHTAGLSIGGPYGRGIGYGPNGIGWGFGYGYYRKAPTGKSLISYYAPNVPVLHQGSGGGDNTKSLAAPAYPGAQQKAGSSSTSAKQSGGIVMDAVEQAVVDAVKKKDKSTPTKPR